MPLAELLGCLVLLTLAVILFYAIETWHSIDIESDDSTDDEHGSDL